jgi:hypothetical protein
VAIDGTCMRELRVVTDGKIIEYVNSLKYLRCSVSEHKPMWICERTLRKI